MLTGMLVLAGVALAQTAGAVGWLGVYSQQITPELRDGINYNGSGALVSRVVPGSPADKAGIERGDVIVRVGTNDVDSPERLIGAVRSSPVDSPLDVLVIRDGHKQRLDVTLVTRPDVEGGQPGRDNDDDDALPPTPMRFHVMTPDMPTPPPDMHDHDNDNDSDGDHDGDDDHQEIGPEHLREVDPDSHAFEYRMPNMSGMPGMMQMAGRGRLGVRIESLTPELGSYFGSRGQSGALVLDVTKGSAAEEAGIQPGDVITRVEQRDIKDADDLMEAVRSSEGRVSISLVRHGVRQTVEVSLPRADRIMRFRGGAGTQGQGWKRGADGSWNWSSPDGSRRVKRLEIHGDRDKDSGNRADISDRDRDDVQSLREELRQLREELRQLREERRERDRDQDEDNR